MKNEPGDSSCDVYMKALDCGFLVRVASYHVSGVSYGAAKDHAEYHAQDRESCNSNADNSDELELNTDYGLDFVNAVLGYWKLLRARGLDLLWVFLSAALKRGVEGNESPISLPPVFKVVVISLFIHGLNVSYSYPLAYEGEHSRGYFSGKYHQQAGEERSEHALRLPHGSAAPEEAHGHHQGPCADQHVEPHVEVLWGLVLRGEILHGAAEPKP